MKLSSEALSATLENELGAEAVETKPHSLASHAVDGKVPTLLCLPATPEQVGSVLRLCAEAHASVIPWGGGTSMSIGNIPRQADVVVGLERLDKLIEHDDANLTATAQAGMRVASFQQILGQRRQFLAVDAPHPSQATLGGMVAANVNGPRRLLYGGLRDLVIGMKMALASGEGIKAGGKVVKNVAGYDMCKLFVGSLGTLGIITEVTFKVGPVPQGAASFIASGPSDQCARFADQLLCSPLLPAAVAILSADAVRVSGSDSRTPVIVIWVEGFEEAIARQLRDLGELAQQVGLASELLRDEPHGELWEEIENFGANGDGVLYRITVPVGSVAEVLAQVDRWSRSEKSARYVAHAGTGTLWLLLDSDSSSVRWFPRIAALAQSRRGHAVIAAAPAGLKEGLDVWGTAPPSLAIMREIKRQFDPQGILNPGRFLAGV